MQNIAFIILVALFLVRILGRLKPQMEMRQAMMKGKVTVTGNSMSFKNPLTVRIKK